MQFEKTYAIKLGVKFNSSLIHERDGLVKPRNKLLEEQNKKVLPVNLSECQQHAIKASIRKHKGLFDNGRLTTNIYKHKIEVTMSLSLRVGFIMYK